ncbi:hypothetical protein MCAV_06990 [[Mycoplasma] cavipharyngis]|uniref:hypothetical protein n=1 Tax=[Mycoplasma] cavipharyngis TaxID=92757 RepID=UPI0037037173
MKFKTRKILTIGGVLGLGFTTVGAVAGYINLKPIQKAAGTYAEKNAINYQALAQARIESAAAQKNTKNNSLKVEQVFQAKKNNQPAKPAKSVNGLDLWRYGKGVFAMHKSDDISKYPTDFTNKSSFLTTDLLIAQLMKFAGYQSKTKPNPKSIDAFEFVGQFLNQVAPFIPNVLGLNPVEIVDTGVNRNISEMNIGFDTQVTFQEYGARPTVDVYGVLINTYNLYMLKNFRPLTFNDVDTLSEDNKFANAFAFAILARKGAYSEFLETQLIGDTDYAGWKKSFSDIFFNDGSDFSHSQILSYLVQPKDATKNGDNDEPLFKSLGSNIKEVKELVRSKLQDLAISFLEDLKLALLIATYKQITKYLLQNMGWDDENYQRYGTPGITSTNAYIGLKKDVYDKFKAALKKATEIKDGDKFVRDSDFYDLTFNQLEKGNTSAYNFRSEDITNDYYQGIDATGKPKKGDPNFYIPLYAARSTSYLSVNNPSNFSLTTNSFPFSPSTIDPESGAFNQKNIDTKNLFRNTQPYFNSLRTATFAFNYYQDKNFSISNETNTKGFVTQSNNTQNSTTKQISAKSYLVNTPGLNIFVQQFLPLMKIFVTKEINYLRKNPTEIGDKTFNPRSVDNNDKFHLLNAVNLLYNQFINQSRGDVQYYLDSTGNRIAVNTASPINRNDFITKNETILLQIINEKNKDQYSLTPNVRQSIISEANAYTFYQIAKELYDNIVDYASTIPKYNVHNVDPGNIHWDSIDQFNEAALFYFVNLGGTRNYSFSNQYLRSASASLNTSSINRTTGAYGYTDNGDEFNYEPKTQFSNISWFENIASYHRNIPTILALLNQQNINNEYYKIKTIKSPNGEKFTDAEVIDHKLAYLKFLSSFSSNGLKLYDDNTGEITDVAKTIINLFDQEVLGTKYFFANMQFNEKVDEFLMLNGYFKKGYDISEMTNLFNQRKIDFVKLEPKITWAAKFGGFSQANYTDPNLDKLVGFAAVGMNFGLFESVDFSAISNSNNTLNYLDIKSNQPLTSANDLMINPNTNVNGYSNFFAPLRYGYDQTTKQFFVNVKKNWILPN